MMVIRKAHLVGIGGTGLSAIAIVLLGRGISVSGSDRQWSPLALRAQAAGAEVFIGHRAENLQGVDVVLVSSAIPADNPELQAAKSAGIPVLKRVDFLGWLTAGYRTLAVAGTHGKTTTTAMLAWILTSLGSDPSYIIGGVSANLGNNAHHGLGSFFVIEADEYDRMFLGLNPEVAIITNIEHDHPDYYPSAEDFYAAFAEFADRIVPKGALLACGDDRNASRLLNSLSGNPFTPVMYGLDREEYPCRADLLRLNRSGGFDFRARIEIPGRKLQVLQVSLRVPGKHNVLNALAALSTICWLGLEAGQAAYALGEFSGAGRRFELRGEVQGIVIIDDYAHHPTEIRATLAAARSRYPDRPLWAIWQPHTFSRTRLFFSEFAAAFDQADHVLITEIYAAREPVPADGLSARQVVQAMHHPDVEYAPDLISARVYLLSRLQPGEVVLVLSAGDADTLSTDLLNELMRSLDQNQAPMAE